MRILAIDPGHEQSAWILFDGTAREFGIIDNAEVLRRITDFWATEADELVIEQIASFGMPVGAEVFETVFWSGRFCQAWGRDFHRVKRLEVKMALCHDSRANDAAIRQALIDRFGPGKDKAIGVKASPGPLYGVSKDVWSALAVAVAFMEKRVVV